MAAADAKIAQCLMETTAAVGSVLPADPMKSKLQALKAEQDAMRVKKQQLRKAMKNAKRQVSRLKKRARLLTDEDLVAVLLMRRTRLEDGSTASSSSSSAGTSTCGDAVGAASLLPPQANPSPAASRDDAGPGAAEATRAEPLAGLAPAVPSVIDTDE